MGRTILGVGTALVMVALVALQPDSGSAAAQGRRTPAGTRFSGKAFRFNQVKPGIYHAVGTGALTSVGNSSVIVNDQDVVVVDDHISPAAAWVLLEEVRALTNKPVRTVITLESVPGHVRLTGAETTLRFEALWKFSFHQKLKPKSPGGRQAPGRNRQNSWRRLFRRF